MGKKSATKRGSSSPGGVAAADEIEALSSEVQKLKDEGNKLFGRKEYQRALDAYEKALKASDNSAAEAPLLHSNKAACLMMLQRFKEAINECSSALEVDAQYAKALTRRAKAYEAMGHYKQALSDIQKANKADSANPDTQEAEKRLKDLVAGKSRANGIVTANGVKKGPSKGRQQPMLVFPVKCTLDGETRVMHILGHTTYAELLEQVTTKFPTAPPFALKYLDKEGDLVTITDKNDLAAALEELVQSADKLSSSGGHGGRPSLQHMLPPLRLQLVPVASQADVPKPPAEEVAHLEQLQQARRVLQAQAMGQNAKTEQEQQQQPQEMYEIEQWLVDFANLFRDSLGIEPDRHLDLTNYGWEKMQAALDSAVLSDKAPALFDQAADRFQDVTAHGLLQWGNVHLCKAKRIIDKAAAEGRPFSDITEDAEALFAKAEDKYNESLRTKPDFYDGAASIANLFFERGRLAVGFAMVPPKPDQPVDKQVDLPDKVHKGGKSEKEAKEAEEAAKQSASQAANQESLKKALAKLTKDSLQKGEPLFQKAWAKFQEAIDMLPESEKNKPLKPQQAGQEGATAGSSAEEEANVWAHCQVMWGNLLYELSQMKAAVGEEWKSMLDEATAKFRAAGCPEADIRQALSGHTMKEHIDLGPEPEPEKSKENGPAKPVVYTLGGKPEASVKTEKEDEKVKGLPSLGPKPKKKTPAE